MHLGTSDNMVAYIAKPRSVFMEWTGDDKTLYGVYGTDRSPFENDSSCPKGFVLGEYETLEQARRKYELLIKLRDLEKRYALLRKLRVLNWDRQITVYM